HDGAGGEHRAGGVGDLPLELVDDRERPLEERIVLGEGDVAGLDPVVGLVVVSGPEGDVLDRFLGFAGARNTTVRLAVKGSSTETSDPSCFGSSRTNCRPSRIRYLRTTSKGW